MFKPCLPLISAQQLRVLRANCSDLLTEHSKKLCERLCARFVLLLDIFPDSVEIIARWPEDCAVELSRCSSEQYGASAFQVAPGTELHSLLCANPDESVCAIQTARGLLCAVGATQPVETVLNELDACVIFFDGEREVQRLNDRLDSESSRFDEINGAVRSGLAKLLFEDKMTVIWANDYFYDIIGCSREYLHNELNDSYANLVSYESDLDFRQEMLRSFEETGRASTSVRMYCADGTKKWVYVSSSLTDEIYEGKRVVYTIIIDITASYTEQVVAENYSRFLNLLYNNLLTGICEFSLDWLQIQHANRAVFEMLECDEESVRERYGNSLTNFIHPEDRPNVIAHLKSLVLHSTPSIFECRYLTAKGNIRWARCSISVISGFDEREIGLLEVTNITDIREMVSELEQVDRYIPAIVMRITAGTHIAIHYTNKRFREFFGTDISRGEAMLDFVHPDDKETLLATIAKMRRGENFSTVIRFYNRDRELRWLHFGSSCVGLLEDTPDYYCVALDISEQMNLSSELQHERQKYQAALQGTSDIIFDYDIVQDKLVFYGNPLDSTVSRLKRHHVSHFRTSRLRPGLFSEDDISTINAFLTGRRSGPIEMRLHINNSDGITQVSWFTADGNTIYEHNSPSRVIGRCRPISGQDHMIYKRIAARLDTDTERRYALIRMDYDNFMVVNNVFGWEEGNRLLDYTASQLKDRLSDSDAIFGRVMSDIFCILVPFERDEQLISLCLSLSARLSGYSQQYNVTPHFGIYYVTDRSAPVSVMFDYANLALKTVKGNKLASYAFFDDNLRNRIIETGTIETQMEAALKNHEFVIHLQPKFDMRNSKIVGAEALVRWQHPDKGLLSPEYFLPVFEQNRFIIKLDEYVWEQVCIILRSWIDRGLTPLPISINISRLHIYDVSFVARLNALIDSYNIPRQLLVLEFTESVFVEDVDSLYHLIDELTREHYSISSDDFGAGYSSLNMLKNVPFNEVKLDREFLNHSVSDDKGKTIMRGIISMLCSLGVDIVAEGVESQEQADFLLSVGCNTAQGFLYSRPLCREEFEKIAFNK